MDFGAALKHLKAGHKVFRRGWNGVHHLLLHDPVIQEPSTQDYILIFTEKGDIIPWLASQADVLAEDWCVDEASTD